jgi:16S rRNA (cytosine967-C5)-methyltransferase
MSDERKGARLRAEAAKVVDAVVSNGRSLDAALATARVAERDLSLLRLLCFGAIRHHWRLRWQVSQLLDRPLKKRDQVIMSLLAVGIYQIEQTRIPDHAAVSMTVEAAKVLRRPKYTGLINAVLRNFMRRNLAEAKVDSDEAMFDHPEWLLRRLRQDWPDQWRDVVKANNEQGPMWLRVNRRRCQRDEYVEQLATAGIATSTIDGAEEAVCLDQPLDVGLLPGFAEGLVSVQDASAQIAAPWLLADGGMRLLDACAAPGGKTGHLLELAASGASLTAIDVDERRLGDVRQNLQRLGLDATLCASDASNTSEWWDNTPYDRILLDAPCSASGVIRRHPDIKLLRRERDIGVLAERQLALLEALWGLLAPGGRLLYVTCSVLSEENEQVVERFLALHPDAVESKVLPNCNIRDLMYRKTCGYQVLPGSSGLDGFYYACLEKGSGNKI